MRRAGPPAGRRGTCAASSWYLQSQLFALEPTDPTTFLCAVAALLMIAAAACAVPARRAAGVDAVLAIKEE